MSVKRGVNYSVLFMLILIMSIKSVFGFGMAHQYLENKTLYLNAGEIYLFEITLQNGEGKPAIIRFKLNSDENIATVLNYTEFYELPSRTYDKKITVLLKVPADSKVNDTYNIHFSAQKMPEGNGLTMGVGLNNKVKVMVKEGSNDSAAIMIAKMHRAFGWTKGVFNGKKETVMNTITGSTVKSAAVRTLSGGLYALLILSMIFTLIMVWKKSDSIAIRIADKIENISMPSFRAPGFRMPKLRFPSFRSDNSVCSACHKKHISDAREYTLEDIYIMISHLREKSFDTYITHHHKELTAVISRKFRRPALAELLQNARSRQDFLLALRVAMEK